MPRGFGLDQLQPLFILALETRAGFRHAAVDLFLDSDLPRANIVLRLGNLALPRLQPFKIEVALGSLQCQRFLTPLEFLPFGRCPFQQRKGSSAQLHLLLQGIAPVLELPLTLLGGFASPVCLLSLLVGSGAGLP